jgi:pimeloyl-ACP methyl ester carboxylesterase
MSAILLDDRVVHYEVLGRGRPILFLHGWVGSWRYWIPAMQVASSSYRSFALDQWGFGDTARDHTLYTLERQVILLELFMQELGIGKIAFVGHGLGAILAVLFARKNPQQVDRIMAISMPFDAASAAARLRSPASPADLADWLLARNPVSEAARVDAPKADPLAITTSFGNLQTMNLMAILHTINIPTLLVHGVNDPAIQMPDYERMMSMPDHIHEVVLEESGHFPMLDESPKFNRLMSDFLALLSGESPRQLQLKEEWKRRMR